MKRAKRRRSVGDGAYRRSVGWGPGSYRTRRLGNRYMGAPASASTLDGLPVPRRYWAILATVLAITMSVLDSSIANVAPPVHRP